MTTRNPSARTRGHVFVVKADVTTIMCDAWLCSTDREFYLESWARKGLGIKDDHLNGYDWDRRRAIVYDGDASPLVILGDVGQTTASRSESIGARMDELLGVIDDFVAVATDRLGRGEPGLPLRLALPLIGTGKGGLEGVQGGTFRRLLTKLDSVAHESQVDFVLCTYSPLAWSAVQEARSEQQWPLSIKEDKLAKDLADEAKADRLVLFIGAGACRDVNLPAWRQLLEGLSQSHRIHLSSLERQSLSSLDPRDYATLIQNDLSREELLQKLTDELWPAAIYASGSPTRCWPHWTPSRQ